MVLSRGVNFIEEFLLASFVSIIRLNLTHRNGGLMLEVLLEHLIVLSCQSFDCNSALLAEVVIWVLAERPLYKFFQRHNLIWLRLREFRRYRNYGLCCRKAQVDVGAAVFKNIWELLKLIKLLNSVSANFLDCRSTCLEENSLGD